MRVGGEGWACVLVMCYAASHRITSKEGYNRLGLQGYASLRYYSYIASSAAKCSVAVTQIAIRN
jgi:hypothetical protein